MEENFYVYMLASKKDGVIYKGMSSDLVKRISEHKANINCKYTMKYKVKRLVWYRQCGCAEDAIS